MTFLLPTGEGQVKGHAPGIYSINALQDDSTGPFIADFACVEKKLLIELDGIVLEEQKDYDRERESFLRKKGFTVLRFTNDEVYEDTDRVVTIIKSHCAPHPDPLPRGEGPL